MMSRPTSVGGRKTADGEHGAKDHSLTGLKVFRGLSDENLGSLSRASHRRAVTRGGALFVEGAPSLDALVILRGLVKVVRQSADGAETILGLFGPREPVGLAAVLEGTPYPATALALSERVEVLCIPRPILLDLMTRDPRWTLSLNEALLQHTMVLRTKIDVMSAGAVSQRLAVLLTALADRFGDELEDGTVFLPVALSRGELSSLVGARAETTIRVLSRWRKRGWLSTTRDGVVLHDTSKLKALRVSVAEDSS